jgi:hypothetical protein
MRRLLLCEVAMLLRYEARAGTRRSRVIEQGLAWIIHTAKRVGDRSQHARGATARGLFMTATVALCAKPRLSMNNPG